MQHRAARQAGALGDHGGRRPRIAKFHKTLDRRVDDLVAGGRAFLRLPGRGAGLLVQRIAVGFHAHVSQ
jgi:hypothetical protein